MKSSRRSFLTVAAAAAGWTATGIEGNSRYRTGQFKVGEIRVLWTEHGH